MKDLDFDKRNQIYNKDYYNNYVILKNKTISYENKVQNIEFFDNLKVFANNIVKTINPKSILDIGCAFGYIVEAFRDLGVQAYGIDVSEYAISKVHPKISKYCANVSAENIILPEHFPKTYDLVFNCEVIEHIEEKSALISIKNMCNLSNKILFSSTPDDYEDETHININPEYYWSKQFAKNGFYRNLRVDLNFLTPHAMLFEKIETEIPDLVENYEIKLLNEKTVIKNLHSKQYAFLKEKERFQIIEAKMQDTILQLKEELIELKEENKKIYKDYVMAFKAYTDISNSFWWKTTSLFRRIGTHIKAFLSNNNLTRNLYKFLVSLRRNGIKITLRKVQNAVHNHNNNDPNMLANGYEYKPLSKTELLIQKNVHFKNDIKISIVVPVYNTPIEFLKEMIESVKEQTYKNWELCIADGSDIEHKYVEAVCSQYSNEDKRILYKKLKSNNGISENTNEAIAMATGEYIALFDHDDYLHPSALYYCMIEIDKSNPDFIYTDESVFKNDMKNIIVTHFKSDFAIDTLRSINYICHFSVIKKTLLDEVGGCRKEFDGSQDFDLFLRLLEKTNDIVHIPKVLYFWRSHEGSTAQSIGAKPYVLDSGKNAVSEHLKRVGLKGKVVDIPQLPSSYKVNYEINGNPMVSILIPNKDHIKDLEVCINSIIKKSTYQNYEIIIIENNSEQKSTFDYYKKIENIDKLKVIYYEDEFNYSLINNFAAKQAKGDYLIMLNNDIEILTENWIEEMLMYAQRKDVGAVGIKLLYPDKTIQHAGIVIGTSGTAGHYHKYFHHHSIGYMGRLAYVQNVSAVTAACLMVDIRKFNEIEGFNPKYKVAFNDVDFCLRLRKCGYLNIFNPFVEAFHYESKSRGLDTTGENAKRFSNEAKRLQTEWLDIFINGDPYYNENLTLHSENFALKNKYEKRQKQFEFIK